MVTAAQEVGEITSLPSSAVDKDWTLETDKPFRLRKELMTVMAATAFGAFAEVKVQGIFSDDMVLQRGKPIPVKGLADPGETVTVAYNGVSATAKAGADGRFRVVLPAQDVQKKGLELTVSGKNTVTFKNVLVGDVWLVSGQSNAEMSFRSGVLKGKEAAEETKDFPNIRAIKFDHVKTTFPVRDVPCNKGPWRVINKWTINDVTAAGYFMAREINRETGVPVGILDNNWSGCQIEPFMCLEGLELVPEFAGQAEKVKASRDQLADWCAKVAALRASGDYGNVGQQPGVYHWTSQHNAMIEPIVDFPIAGAVWYQGCSNGNEGMSYVKKLEALIGGWRKKWGYEFPFYIVQLAAFQAKTDDPAGGNGYAKIRNAMRIASQTIPKTGLAVAIDIGNDRDIHPKNKYDVGYRLSRWALRDVYGKKDVVVSGPLFKKLTVEGAKARVSFDHVGSGLFAGEKGPDTPGEMPTATPDGKLRGFAIAGADKQWFWADAVIDGKDVVVSSKDVPRPVAVRYAFRANPMGNCNLYNKEGLPASPFRTDAW